jgi:hypothetical protein
MRRDAMRPDPTRPSPKFNLRWVASQTILQLHDCASFQSGHVGSHQPRMITFVRITRINDMYCNFLNVDIGMFSCFAARRSVPQGIFATTASGANARGRRDDETFFASSGGRRPNQPCLMISDLPPSYNEAIMAVSTPTK